MGQMKLAIIVDSTAGLPADLAGHPDIYQVNLSINFPDNSSMEDSTDPKVNDDFYQKLASSTTLPTTSQPLIGKYYELMDEIVDKAYEGVICIHLSGNISGTTSTAHMLIEEYSHMLATHVIDSKSASVAVVGMVKQVLRMNQDDFAFDEMVNLLQRLVEETKVYFMVQDLYNLTKGGRLSGAGAIVGTMLKIRPILTFDSQGQMIVCEKIRTNKKVYARFIEWIKEANNQFPKGYEIAIVHTQSQDQAIELEELIQQQVADIETSIGILSPVLGVHTGQGLVGFGILPKVENFI